MLNFDWLLNNCPIWPFLLHDTVCNGSNGYMTDHEWSPICSFIVPVITKSDECEEGDWFVDHIQG